MADLRINPRMRSTYPLIALVCLGVVACNGSSVASSSPSPVKASTGSVSPVNVYPGPALGPAPSSCSRPTPRTVNPSFGLAIGESTVYAVGAWDSTGVMHVDRATQTQHGEQVKVLWVIKSGFNQPVSVRGKSMSTGRPLYFEIGDSSPTTTPTLDPNSAPVSEGDWPNFPSYLDIPAADCYIIDATWSGGQWQVEFPAGD
jgi:hypothetical protein